MVALGGADSSPILAGDPGTTTTLTPTSSRPAIKTPLEHIVGSMETLSPSQPGSAHSPHIVHFASTTNPPTPSSPRSWMNEHHQSCGADRVGRSRDGHRNTHSALNDNSGPSFTDPHAISKSITSSRPTSSRTARRERKRSTRTQDEEYGSSEHSLGEEGSASSGSVTARGPVNSLRAAGYLPRSLSTLSTELSPLRAPRRSSASLEDPCLRRTDFHAEPSSPNPSARRRVSSSSGFPAISERSGKPARTAVDRLRNQAYADEGGSSSGTGGGDSTTSSSGARRRAQSLQMGGTGGVDGVRGDAGSGRTRDRAIMGQTIDKDQNDLGRQIGDAIPRRRGRRSTMVEGEVMLGKARRQRSNTLEHEFEAPSRQDLALRARKRSRGESMRSITFSESMPVGMVDRAAGMPLPKRGPQTRPTTDRKGRNRDDYGLGFEAAMAQNESAMLPPAAVQSVLASMDLTNALRLIAQQGLIPPTMSSFIPEGQRQTAPGNTQFSPDGSLRSTSPLPMRSSPVAKIQNRDPFVATAPPPLVPDDVISPAQATTKSWHVPSTTTIGVRIGREGRSKDDSHVLHSEDQITPADSDSDSVPANPRSPMAWRRRSVSNASTEDNQSSTASANLDNPTVPVASLGPAQPTASPIHQMVMNATNQSPQAEKSRRRISSLFHRKSRTSHHLSEAKDSSPDFLVDEMQALGDAQDRVQAALLELPQHPMAEKMAYQARSHLQAYYGIIYRSATSPTLSSHDAFLRYNPLRVLRWKRESEVEATRKKKWEDTVQAEADVQDGAGDLNGNAARILTESPTSAKFSNILSKSPGHSVPRRKRHERHSLQRTVSRSSKATVERDHKHNHWLVTPMDMATFQDKKGQVEHFVPSAEAITLMASSRSESSQGSRSLINGSSSRSIIARDWHTPPRQDSPDDRSMRSRTDESVPLGAPHPGLRGRQPSRESLRVSDALVNAAKGPFRKIRNTLHRHHDLDSTVDLGGSVTGSEEGLDIARQRDHSGASDILVMDFAKSADRSRQGSADPGESSRRTAGEEYTRRMRGIAGLKGIHAPILVARSDLRLDRPPSPALDGPQTDPRLVSTYEERAQVLITAQELWEGQLDDIEASADAPHLLLQRVQAETDSVALLTGFSREFPGSAFSRAGGSYTSGLNARSRKSVHITGTGPMHRRPQVIDLADGESSGSGDGRPVYAFAGEILDPISRLELAVRAVEDGYSHAFKHSEQLSERQDKLQRDVSNMIARSDDLRNVADELGSGRVRKYRATLDHMRLPTDRPINSWLYTAARLAWNTVLVILRGYVYVKRLLIFIGWIVGCILLGPIWILLTPFRWFASRYLKFANTKEFLYIVIGSLVLALAYTQIAVMPEVGLGNL